MLREQLGTGGAQPRTVWVTGATSGIGRACVARLAAAGHRVVASGRRQVRLAALADQYDAGRVWTVTCDVQDRRSMEQAFAALPEGFRQVDTLVNNAGLMLGLGTFVELRPDEMQTMVMTNCMGVLHATAVLLPTLRASGRGHLVNITSIASRYPYVTGHVYAATKAFVEHFGNNLRPEVVGWGMRVTNIAPGRVDTEFNLVRAGSDAGRAVPPAGAPQPLAADDVARAVCWALEQPAHVNVNSLELVPAQQSLSFR